jgi:hypothetical protein
MLVVAEDRREDDGRIDPVVPTGDEAGAHRSRLAVTFGADGGCTACTHLHPP